MQAVKDVNEAVKKGAQETTKITRAEAASRVYAISYIVFEMKKLIILAVSKTPITSFPQTLLSDLRPFSL